MKVGDIDLSKPESFVERVPHEYFALLRREAPVSWQERTDGSGPGFWNITKYADIAAIEKQVPLFTSRTNISPMAVPELTIAGLVDRTLIVSDPPRQDFLRRMVMSGFTPKAIQKIEAQIRQYATEALDSVIERGQCDFVEVAAYMPVEVISDVLGVEAYDRPRLFDWANQKFGMQDPEISNTMQNLIASMELGSFARQLAQKKRVTPGDDIFSMISVAEENGDRLTDFDLGALFVLMATAGNETTRTMITHATLMLIENREVAEELRADASLIPNAIDEMLRLTCPASCFARKATQDTEVGGQLIKAGDQVVMWFCSGSRDEAVFPDPDRLDIRRANAREHMAFGTKGAIHHCLGSMLARSEVRVMIEMVLERMPDIELAGPPARLQSNFTNGIKRMPVRFTPGRATEQPARNYLYGAHGNHVAPLPPPPQPSPFQMSEGDRSMSIQLIPLATATLQVGTPSIIKNGPKGTRMVVDVVSAIWEGERLNAKQATGPAGDWALVAPDGTLSIDVRATLETHDGAIIYLSYQGRSDYSQAGAKPLIIAPQFETSDARYAWLNKVQAIGRGRMAGAGVLIYDIYEVQ